MSPIKLLNHKNLELILLNDECPMNKNETIIFTFFAALYSVVTLAEENLFNSNILGFELNHWITKLIPMVILIAISFKRVETKTHKLFLTGLIFSITGDFFLGYDGVNWFLYGLGSFFIAHLYYLSSLYPLMMRRPLAVVAYTVYGAVMLSIIMPGLGSLLIPVLIYMSVLLLMGIFTLTSKISNHWLILGGLSFVISDSLLGVNKFYTAFPYSHFLIMLSYYFAQFALVKGIFKAQQSEPS